MTDQQGLQLGIQNKRPDSLKYSYLGNFNLIDIMKKLYIAFVFLLLLSSAGFSQMTLANGDTYKLGIGLRGAWVANGLDVKYFMDHNSKHALEGIIGAFWGRFDVTLLYEWHFDLGVEGLQLYVGAGGHIRHYGPRWANRSGSWNYYNGPGSGLHAGVDGVVGLEYKIYGAPIAVGADFKPFYELDFDGDGYVQSDFALKVLFTLE
jgi:hypothetical protein